MGQKNKTDAKDAVLLYHLGCRLRLVASTIQSKALWHLKKKSNLLDSYIIDYQYYNNKIEAYKQGGIEDSFVLESIKEHLKDLSEKIAKLEADLSSNLGGYYADLDKLEKNKNYYSRMMAVPNKLVRQIYGVVKSKLKYQDDYGLDKAVS